LDQLLDRVDELTQDHGAKKGLARDLKITPQSLNDWLKGRFAPNGEATLRLLRWVTAQELEQNGNLEGVLSILLDNPAEVRPREIKHVQTK